jgi:hypothetical protein
MKAIFQTSCSREISRELNPDREKGKPDFGWRLFALAWLEV